MSKNDFASESGHWYDTDGNCAYEMPYADPKKGMRPTTLRDARKHNLFPSVTTIMKVKAAPGLERWKINQAIDSALTLPMNDGESLDAYKLRVLADASEQGRKAAEYGTYIHGVLESFYATGNVHKEHTDIVCAVDKMITAVCGNQEWCAEKSFASTLGYGGKVDLHSPNWIIDFKTKEFSEDDV